LCINTGNIKLLASFGLAYLMLCLLFIVPSSKLASFVGKIRAFIFKTC
jgi:hypothetical protein